MGTDAPVLRCFIYLTNLDHPVSAEMGKDLMPRAAPGREVTVSSDADATSTNPRRKENPKASMGSIRSVTAETGEQGLPILGTNLLEGPFLAFSTNSR